MKFGKSILAEARNNRGLSFINFKYLKRILKRCGVATRSGSWTVAKDEDVAFYNVLEAELRKVRDSYWKELRQISTLQSLIRQKLPLLDIQPDPETYTRMGFEQLQAHLQSLGGLREGSSTSDRSSSSVRVSAALCEFCLNLGKISSRCKRLRRCVLWNAVAIVKILKKREKLTNLDKAALEVEPLCSRQSAAQVLSQQDWYRCSQLPQIVSMVETTTDELMQRLTLKPPSKDQYRCPICLDVVLDPVCLRTCGHRFCWACLCMAYCAKPEGTLERCPCCRAAFPLDPEAFQVDGILSRFLKNYFPEDHSTRLVEQRENLRQRLEDVQKEQQNQKGSLAGADEWSASTGDEEALKDDGFIEVEEQSDVDVHHQHCCPDCLDATHIIHHDSSLHSYNVIEEQQDKTVSSSSVAVRTRGFNEPLVRTANNWLNNDPTISSQPSEMQLMVINSTLPEAKTQTTAGSEAIESPNKKQRQCRHVWNVKLGKPSDIDWLASTTTSSACSETADGSLVHAWSSSSTLFHIDAPLEQSIKVRERIDSNPSLAHISCSFGELTTTTGSPLSSIISSLDKKVFHKSDPQELVNSVISSLLAETPSLEFNEVSECYQACLPSFFLPDAAAESFKVECNNNPLGQQTMSSYNEKIFHSYNDHDDFLSSTYPFNNVDLPGQLQIPLSYWNFEESNDTYDYYEAVDDGDDSIDIQLDQKWICYSEEDK